MGVNPIGGNEELVLACGCTSYLPCSGSCADWQSGDVVGGIGYNEMSAL
jgi:hypothetical protein